MNRYSLILHNRAMETGEPPVMDTPEFHNNNLLRQAWRPSPYNKHLSLKKGGDVRAEIIREAMCFQPFSGFCGIATVNTVLRSLQPPYYVPFTSKGRGYSMVSLAEYLILNCAPSHFLEVDVIYLSLIHI